MNTKCIYECGTIDGNTPRCRLNNVNQKGSEIRLAYMSLYNESDFYRSGACLFCLRNEQHKCPYFNQMR